MKENNINIEDMYKIIVNDNKSYDFNINIYMKFISIALPILGLPKIIATLISGCDAIADSSEPKDAEYWRDCSSKLIDVARKIQDKEISKKRIYL